MRKYIFLIILLLSQYIFASEINPDLPELLNKIDTICADRWDIEIGKNNIVFLNSKEKVLGEARGYSYPLGEHKYKLSFRFKIVSKVNIQEATKRKQKLNILRKQSKKIKHTNIKGKFHYKPVGKKQWTLVVKIKKAEQKVEDIPEYQFKSVYISEEYSMAFFIPNKQSLKALQYKKDINAIYKLFKITD